MNEIKNASEKTWHERPSSYWDVVCHHLPLALVTGLPMIIAFLIPLKYIPLRPCTFMSLTGYPCPFCGFTRSFLAIASGDLQFALNNCPLSVVLFLCCVLIFMWNLAGLITGLKLSIPERFKPKKGKVRYLLIFISLLFLANWGWRLIEGLK